MRLITKINSYFAAILIILMGSVFIFTHFFVQKEFRAQVESSLQVTYVSLKLTLENINTLKIQQGNAFIESRGDAIRISTKDSLYLVLQYYLNKVATNNNLNLVEVINRNGFLLADNNKTYHIKHIKLNFRKPKVNTNEFYLTKRDKRVYLMSTIPILYTGETVGYLNLGTLVDQKLIAYFSSVLNSNLMFYATDRYLIGNSKPIQIPEEILNFLKKYPKQNIFLPGDKITHPDFDYIFFTVPSDSSFSGIIAIARNRRELQAALWRLNIFLCVLTGFGLFFGFFGANLLARNIKKSIFGMEPQEIASLLDQRTTILQSTFEGIIAIDREGLITLVNNEVKQILPNNLEIIGQPAENLFPDLKIKEVLQTGQDIYNQRQVIGETIIVYNCVLIKAKNHILGAVITLRDLTEFQKVAEELVEVKNYTQALRAQSHEFMNKLQSVSGLIQLGKYETALTILHETTESQQDLISFLNEAFSTSAVSGILLGKYNRAKELNIQFEIKQTSHIPNGMHLPDHELVCIIGNLIENAFEALRESPQPLKRVWVKISPTRGSLRVAVIDNGAGIPLAIRGLIFDRGFTTRKSQNKGIGLSLVKQSVENLHGTIKVYSKKHTIFIVKIPLKDGGI